MTLDEIKELATELAYEIVNHDYEKVSDPETLSKIIAKKLKEML